MPKKLNTQQSKKLTKRLAEINRNKASEAKRREKKEIALFLKSNDQNTLFEISWDKVTFKNEYIYIQVNKVAYKYYHKDSQESFNAFKGAFNLTNSPKIRAKVSGKAIIILNESVLFYHFKILKQTNKQFSINYKSSNPMIFWKQYTKDYFEKNLSHLFITATLKKLFLLANPGQSIIPVAEVTKDIKGKIHCIDAFLFQISDYIIWESTETSRATYIFRANRNIDETTQNIFDYISGNTLAKRDTLINSKDLQKELNFKVRIFHTDYSLWLHNLKCEI